MDLQKELDVLFEKYPEKVYDNKRKVQTEFELLCNKAPQFKKIYGLIELYTKNIKVGVIEKQEVTQRYWNYKGRNYVSINEVSKIVFGINDVQDEKLILLDSLVNEATKNLENMFNRKNEAILKLQNDLMSFTNQISTRYLRTIRVPLSQMKPDSVNVAVAYIDNHNIDAVDKLIKRFESGKYRSKKGMIIKIIKTYSRVTGLNGIKRIVVTLREKYPILAKEKELMVI